MSKIYSSVFKKNEIEDFYNGVIATANWIKENEIKDEKGKRWKISDAQDKSLDNVETAFITDTSFYGGASGIGYFFLQLYEATGNEEYLNDAREAADYVINTYEEKNVSKPGIYSGISGYGFFVLYLHEKIHDDKYIEFAKRVADDAYNSSIKDEKGLHWNSLFDYTGDAGVVAYWVYLYEKLGDKKYLEYAKETLDSVLSYAKQYGDDGIYFELIELNEYFSSIPKGGIVPNFAHGTAGIVYLLTKYYNATGDEKYLGYAKQGFNFLKAIANNVDDASIVPYIFFKDGSTQYDVSYLGFCHGPVGDGIVARELYKATKDEIYLDFYKRLTNALIKAGVPYKQSAGYWNNCICCGTSGILLHFLDADNIIPDEEYEKIADNIANKLLDDAFKDVSGNRWYNAWTRLKPWDVEAHLGLFIGAAGNASALLAYYAKKKNKTITPILEYK